MISYKSLILFKWWQTILHIYTLDILFSSNHNIHKSLSGHCFWASDPLIERYLSLKGSEAQKHRPHELL